MTLLKRILWTGFFLLFAYNQVRLLEIDAYLSAPVGTRIIAEGVTAPLTRADGLAVLLNSALNEAKKADPK